MRTTGQGERVVMRLLDKQAGRLDLSRLGMDEKTHNDNGVPDECEHTQY